MTFEEFKELALNPPRRDEETIFEVIEYDVKDLPERKRSHYPKFDVRHYRVGISHTLPEAEMLMYKAINVRLSNGITALNTVVIGVAQKNRLDSKPEKS